MTGWIAPEIVQRFAGALIHSLWQGAAIAALTAIGLRLLHRKSAELRYALAIGALGAMLAGPVLTYAFYREAGAIVLRLLVWTGTTLGSVSPADRVLWTERIVLVWCFGFLSFSGRVALGWRLSSRLARAADGRVPEFVTAIFEEVRQRLDITGPVRLLVHNRIDTPMVVGCLRPIALLPASALTGLSPDELTAVIAHELAHIRRHDFVVNVLQRLTEAVLFYHPAVWWLSARIRAERENCCDDLAVRVSGDRRTYVQALVALERSRIDAPNVAVAASGANLRTRAERLLGLSAPETGWEPTAAALLFVAAWFAVGVWQTAAAVQALPSPIVAVPPPTMQVAAIPGFSPLEPLLLEGAEGTLRTLGALATPPPRAQTQTPPGGAISGRVLMANGEPASGVRVFARDPDAPPSAASIGPASTAIDGRFSLRRVPPGRYVVFAGVPAGQPGDTVYSRGTMNPMEAEVVTVGSEETRGTDFRLVWPVSKVSGRVTQDTRIVSRTPPVLRLTGGPQTFEADTQDDGSFAFQGVPAGKYTLSATDLPAFASPIVIVANSDVGRIEVPIPWTTPIRSRTVVENGPTPAIDLSITDARIRLPAYWSTRRITPSIDVSIPAADAQLVRSPLTDGEYRIAVTRLPDIYEIISLRSGATDLLRYWLNIDGATPDEIVVTLRVKTAVHTVRGQASGFTAFAAASPDAGRAIVTMSGSGLLSGFMSPVQPDGSFEFTNVPPGLYWASVMLKSTPPLPLKWDDTFCFHQIPDCIAGNVRSFAKPVQIVVSDKDVSGVEVPGLHAVSGHVTVRGGGEAPPFLVRVSATVTSPTLVDGRGNPRQQSLRGSTEIAPDGTFRMALPDGEYGIQLTPQDGPDWKYMGTVFRLESITSGGVDLTQGPLKLSGTNPADLLIALDADVPLNPVKVRGRVTPAPTANPTKPATVRLALLPSGTLKAQTDIAADGTFEFSHVLPGRYHATGAGGDSASFDVGGRDVEGVEVVIPRRVEITGKVAMEDGQSIPPSLAVETRQPGRVDATHIEGDGTFKFLLTGKENRRVGVSGLPIGYLVKSIRMGDLDLLANPLNVDQVHPEPLEILIAPAPTKEKSQ